MTVEKEELIRLFDEFLNRRGQWFNFVDFVEGQGYTAEELGFPE